MEKGWDILGLLSHQRFEVQHSSTIQYYSEGKLQTQMLFSRRTPFVALPFVHGIHVAIGSPRSAEMLALP